jgi:hypothetical protein
MKPEYLILLVILTNIASCSNDQTNKFMDGKNKITIKPTNSVHSGNELVIIPTNQKYRPSADQIKASLDFIQKMYSDCEINSEIYDSIEFIDQGQNFEQVSCNYCKKEIPIEFWQERMSESYDSSHFEDMNFLTECCNKTSNLNDLIYKGDCGFASYSISINNTEPDDAKENELANAMTKTLGTKIKIFWRHI